MSGRQAVAGRCRFCGCSSDDCRLPSGGDDRCTWLDLGRTVCSAPSCLRRHFDAMRAAQQRKPRKRTPGEIHHLMQQERRERRRAARARKKGKAL